MIRIVSITKNHIHKSLREGYLEQSQESCRSINKRLKRVYSNHRCSNVRFKQGRNEQKMINNEDNMQLHNITEKTLAIKRESI